MFFAGIKTTTAFFVIFVLYVTLFPYICKVLTIKFCNMEQKAVCGLDVHKDSVFLCIITTDGELIEKNLVF